VLFFSASETLIVLNLLDPLFDFSDLLCVLQLERIWHLLRAVDVQGFKLIGVHFLDRLFMFMLKS
jgi:hypothetical protein